ncbi:MAG: hypothetical protein K2X82_03665 [Gemmataceae bacterium]|nr:hypothetical protein [Gemmataceae bacterium]
MRRLVFGPAVLVGCALAADAQQPPPPGLPSPRLGHVVPAGAKAGTGVEVTAVGFDFDEPTGLLFSHPGITAEYLPPKDDPPDPKKKDAPPPKKKNRAPTEPQPFKVTVKPDVPPGIYDVRVVGKWGVSNPRAFAVGDRPEAIEKEPNNDVPEAQRVELGTTINGVIAASTDVDYAVFTAKKGQRVVLACLASSLDSPAKPVVEVFDPAGRKLATNSGYRDADAVADFVAPADADYLCRVSSVAYQAGGPDHVYRLTIGTGPWIDGVFPPAVEPGKPTQVMLYGRNLPGGQPSPFALDGRPLEQATVTVTPPAEATKLAVRDRVEPTTALQDGFEYRVTGPNGVSNPVTIYLARGTPVLKAGTGGAKPEAAQAVPVGSEVQGMLHRRGGRDWYKFDGKKGEPVMVELLGERAGSPADFVLAVHNGAAPSTSLSGEQDDDPDTLHPFSFYTKSVDPAPLRFVPPADGPFLVVVGCRESSFLQGPPTAYRLRIAPPKPDFRAVVLPRGSYQVGSAGRQGGAEAFDVLVHRIDGFGGAVTVTAKDLPPGVTAKPVVIGPAVRWGTLVLSIAPDAAPFSGTFTVTAAGKVGGADVTREARPATVVRGVQPGQNVPVASRLTQSLALAVRPEKALFALAADPAGATIKTGGKDEKVSGPLVVKPGDKVTVPVKVAWPGDKLAVVLAAEPMLQNQQQAPVAVQPTQQPTKDKPEGVVTLDVRPNAVPGPYTVVVRGDAQVPFAKDPMAKQRPNVPASAFAEPVAFTVLPAALAKVALGPLPNDKLKPGGTVELPVKVERQHDFAGEFQVTFVPAKDVAGITAEPVTIAAGKTEAKLVVKVAEDAKPGPAAANVVVTARYDDKHPIAAETKAGFTVVK